MALAPLLALPDQPATPTAVVETAREPLLVSLVEKARRYRLIIALCIAAALALAVVITLLMTPLYTATTRLEISREQQNATRVEPDERQPAGQDAEFYKTQYALLEARSLAERVVRTLRLDTDAGFFAAHGEEPEGGVGAALTPTLRQARLKRAADLLLAHIDVVPINASRLVDLRYTSASPSYSQRIVDAWGTQFIEAGIDRRYASTAYARRVLEKGLADVGTRLEASERAARAFAAVNDIVPIGSTRDADGKTVIDRTLASANLDTLNNALAEATAARVIAEARAQSPDLSGSGAEGAAGVTAGTLRARRAEVAAELAKTLVQFTAEHPAARALREQLKVLDRSIAAEASLAGRSSTIAYQQAREREQALEQRVGALKAEFKRQQDANIRYTVLLREADTNRQLFDTLLQRSKQVSVSDVGATNVQVVDPAKLPEGPSSPNLALNLLIALFAGLGLAALAVFALDQLDEGISRPDDVSRALGLPFLGAFGTSSIEPAQALLDLKSEVSESALSVQSSLSLSAPEGVLPSIMVTSARAAEGKSTTALALASVLARVGKRVLLLDADMRSASVHVLTGLQNDDGLSGLLSTQTDWRALVQETQYPGVRVITAGQRPPNAAALLSGERFARLLLDLRQEFDHVVVDAPPILDLADAPLLSRAVEGVVVVVEAHGVSQRLLRAMIGRLRAAHAHLLGVVLTKVDVREGGYGYGYGYGRDQG